MRKDLWKESAGAIAIVLHGGFCIVLHVLWASIAFVDGYGQVDRMKT
jgi:hypothetical protein